MNKPNIKSKLTTLKQVDESAEVRSAIDRDFGSAIEDLNDGVSRRRWLQLMGASLALGGMSGCRYEEEQIAPFAFRPQNRIPGIPEKYSAMIDFRGVAQPLVATVFDGRPIKLDGNPDHPESQGASTTFTQGAILNLYDPDRLRVAVKMDGDSVEEISWEDVVSGGKSMFADMASVGIVSESIGSPSLHRMQQELTAAGANWYVFDSVNDDNTRAGSKAAFGAAMRMHSDLENAKVIVCLDADPLKHDANELSNSIKFGAGRDADHGKMNRMYVVESQFSATGAAADHRISVSSSKMAGFVGALKKAIDGASAGGKVDGSLSYRDKVLACMAQDLVDNNGAGVIMCGERQPPEVHAAVHALNEQLGNIGKTVSFTKLPDADRPGCLEAAKSLAADIKSGKIKSLLFLGGNPVFGAPLSLGLAEAIKSVANSAHATTHKNETTVCCKMAINLAHQLETWSDGWAYDGSVCIGQPLIMPLWNGRSEIELLAEFSGADSVTSMDIVKETQGLDAKTWAQSVHDGFVAESAAETESVQVGEVAKIPASEDWKSEWDGSTYEIVFTPSSSVFDGRFSNNAWLQELPDFLTKMTWGNAASISPKTADELGMRTGQVINIGEIGIPVFVQPGQAHGTIGLTIGYGRTVNGMVGGNIQSGEIVGVDVSPLRTAESWNFGSVTEVNPTITMQQLAMVQEPWDIDETGRNEIQARMFRDRTKKETDRSSLIREGTFESYQQFMAHSDDHGHSHDDDHSHDKHSSTVDPTALPVLTNVSFTPTEEDHGDDHGHGGHHNWPEAFHLHHKPFDITPGARMDYTRDNPENKNMWGMSIDLNKCTGCNACVIACQSENNIPIVGKDQVIRGREMHWMRIDRYYGRNLYNDEAYDSDDKQIAHQPVTCQHCENAPCETVCPVAATVHSSEGLNDMVYNRCIGTRYCGNNCPYKVRRFNYLNYSDAKTFLKYPEFKSLGVKGADKLSANDRKVQNLMMNPEVSIRSRGVMEKCTYCTQRISLGKIKAKTEGNRPLGPNEITTACQDVCAAKAIKFGDLNNLESDVRKAHDNARSYTMLEELNNFPRTKYLARVRNPHPALIDRDDRNSVRGHAKPEAHDAGAHSEDSHNETNHEETKEVSADH